MVRGGLLKGGRGVSSSGETSVGHEGHDGGRRKHTSEPQGMQTVHAFHKIKKSPVVHGFLDPQRAQRTTAATSVWPKNGKREAESPLEDHPDRKTLS